MNLRPTMLFLALLELPLSSVAFGGEPADPCRLLALEEIKAISSQATAGKPASYVVDQGAYKGEKVLSCMWSLDATSMLTVTFTRGPRDEGEREAFRKLMRQTSEKLQAAGWTMDRKPVGNARCLTATPPASQPNAPALVGCLTEAKGKGISVGAMGRSLPLDVAKTKALLDKATSRLP